MVKIKNLVILSIFVVVIAVTFLFKDVSSSHLRVPRSIGGMLRRWISGRRKPTGFQGTAQAHHPYVFGSSSNYPSYAPYPFYPSLASYNPSYAYSGFNPTSYPIAASSQYVPTYSSAYGPGYNSNANLDLHQVLDQLVRSAGLSPQGDHEAQASTIQSKGDSPVFSFKKLYSFPFYLSSDSNAAEGYNLHVPFLKRHIRRMSAENQLNQLNQQAQILNSLNIQQELKPLQPQTQPKVHNEYVQNDDDDNNSATQ